MVDRSRHNVGGDALYRMCRRARDETAAGCRCIQENSSRKTVRDVFTLRTKYIVNNIIYRSRNPFFEKNNWFTTKNDQNALIRPSYYINTQKNLIYKVILTTIINNTIGIILKMYDVYLFLYYIYKFSHNLYIDKKRLPEYNRNRRTCDDVTI